MRHRLLRISLLLFVTVWFGLIVPGHRRGQIALPGWSASCCKVAVSHGETPRQKSTPKSESCAVCHLIAVLDLPVAVQLDIPPLLSRRPIALQISTSFHSTKLRPTCQERAPPIA